MPVILRNTHNANLSFQINYLRSAFTTNMTPFSYSPMAVNLRRSGNSASFNINQACSVDDDTALRIVSCSPQILDLEKRGMLAVIRPAAPAPAPAPVAAPVVAPVVAPVEAVVEDVLGEAPLSIPKPNSKTTLANLKAYAAQEGIEYAEGISRKDLYKLIKAASA